MDGTARRPIAPACRESAIAGLVPDPLSRLGQPRRLLASKTVSLEAALRL